MAKFNKIITTLCDTADISNIDVNKGTRKSGGEIMRKTVDTELCHVLCVASSNLRPKLLNHVLALMSNMKL